MRRMHRGDVRLARRSFGLIAAMLSALLMPARTSFGDDIAPSTEEAAQRGVLYSIQPYPPVSGSSGYGCGFVDLDGDGDQDIVIMGAANGRVGLFENTGVGQFIDRTIGSGIPPLPEASAFAAADYDADGRVDLYITQIGEPCLLMHNEGSFHFLNKAAAAGVVNMGGAKGCAWGDYDDDGWVDLYVCNYKNIYQGLSTYPNRLYRNLGDGTFVDVAASMGVAVLAYGFQCAFFDMDRDGDLDLHLTNDRGNLPPLFAGDYQWRNDGGQFTDVSDASGAGINIFAMGLACGDFDRNGFIDLYITNIGSTANPNYLLMNQNGSTFLERHVAAGVGDQAAAWGCIFYDFDNDGWLDLYVNNAFTPNNLYRNAGLWPCADIAAAANVQSNSSLAHYSFSSAVGDVNGDGALDLLLNNHGANAQLFINHEGSRRRWIRYRIVGEGKNTAAIGAGVDTRLGSTWQFRENYAGGNGYLGQNELVIHVGTGGAAIVDEAVVHWPSGGSTRVLTNLPTDHQWTIYPPGRLGDYDGDGHVDRPDFGFFATCYGGPMLPGMEMMDFNGDSVIDSIDYDAFLAVYSGSTLDDCDGDGQLDLVEILASPELDADHDGVLDACQCPPDISPKGGDGTVDIDDLFAVINSWGDTGLSPADVTGNHIVDVDDLFAVINGWGPCPFGG